MWFPYDSFNRVYWLQNCVYQNEKRVVKFAIFKIVHKARIRFKILVFVYNKFVQTAVDLWK